jgi:hypothetical protein
MRDTQTATPDKAGEALRPYGGTVVRSSLTPIRSSNS